MLFIGNMPAEVSRNMHKYIIYIYFFAMWQKCFWQITSTSMTNPIELSPTQVIAMIAQPRYMLMKLITLVTLVSQLEHKPAVTRGSKPQPCGEKPKNPWMPMTFQGDRFCDEFSQKSLTFLVFPRLYISRNVYLVICPCWFWWCSSNLYSLLSGGGRIQKLPWTVVVAALEFRDSSWCLYPQKLGLACNRSIARVGYRILHRKVLCSQPGFSKRLFLKHVSN